MYVRMHIENHHIYLDKFIQITILRVIYYESIFKSVQIRSILTLTIISDQLDKKLNIKKSFNEFNIQNYLLNLEF